MTHIDGLGFAELTSLVQNTAADTATWSSVARFDAADRFYARLHSDSRVDVWLLTWLHDQSTDLHDHGSSAAAFTVLGGELCAVRAATDDRLSTYRRHPGETTWVAPGVVHDVRHSSARDQHPRLLAAASHHDLLRGQARPARADADDRGDVAGVRGDPVTVIGPHITSPRTIDDILALARRRLLRLSPLEAAAEQRSGALLVDIRPEAQRAAEGEIPGSLVIERNVLEWRLDPGSDARLEEASDHGLRVIVFCSQGYTSSLAAASLQDLGLWRATDIDGGFQRWRACQLPTVETRTPAGRYVAFMQ